MSSFANKLRTTFVDKCRDHDSRRSSRRPVPPPDVSTIIRTDHGILRQQQRAISDEQLAIVMKYGRDYSVPGGCILRYMGSREVLKARRLGVDTTGCEGIGAIVTRADGVVVTVVRNRNLAQIRHGS